MDIIPIDKIYKEQMNNQLKLWEGIHGPNNGMKKKYDWSVLDNKVYNEAFPLVEKITGFVKAIYPPLALYISAAETMTKLEYEAFKKLYNLVN